MQATRTSLDDPYDSSLELNKPSSGMAEYGMFDTLQEGFGLIWNTRLAEAESFFKELEEEDDKSKLWKLAALAEVAFWKAVYNGDAENVCCELLCFSNLQVQNSGFSS
jgi:hypothetical protein